MVLTGNLDDGSAGLPAIKDRGGVAVIQDPKEAVAPSMPTSAIENTDVDFVLSAAEIGPKLVQLTASQTGGTLQPISIGGRNIASSGHRYSCPECGGS